MILSWCVLGWYSAANTCPAFLHPGDDFTPLFRPFLDAALLENSRSLVEIYQLLLTFREEAVSGLSEIIKVSSKNMHIIDKWMAGSMTSDSYSDHCEDVIHRLRNLAVMSSFDKK